MNENQQSSNDLRDYTPPAPYPPPPIDRELVDDRWVYQAKGRTSSHSGWLLVAISATMLIAVALVGLVLLLSLNQSTAAEEPIDLAALPTPVDVRVDYRPAPGGIREGARLTLDDGRDITLTRWDGQSRLTILVMGLDRRPGETGLAYRTDTMLLVSYDPAANSLGVLSIPRDLYIDVPGYSRRQRANTPMVLGELQAPGYGPTLAMQTIQHNLGIRVNEYIAVDFEAFITLVDAIGGIEVDVPHAIYDYEYPGMNYDYDPFVIEPGRQVLDGETALKFARTRHNDSDFHRARRQHLVLYAIRDRILNAELLPNLIVQSPTLLASLAENVSTSLTLDQMIQIAVTLRDLPAENIHMGVIDENYISQFLQTDDNQSVLVPWSARLADLMVEVFGANYSS